MNDNNQIWKGKIDFVITWVDESNSKWWKEFEHYSAKRNSSINTDACRCRDWITKQI